MRAFLILLATLFTGLFAAIATPASAAPPVDWSRTVTMTPSGSYVMGNPKAPTHLTEYVSYTCPHCAHFMAVGAPELKAQWVKPGLVSVEVRHAVRDPYDMTAALLAHCAGTPRFFADHEALFANQDAWMAQAQVYGDKHSTGPQPKLSPAALFLDIANNTGLSAFMAKHGLPVARQRQCLADKALLAKLTAMTGDAWQVQKIDGTPAFAINGKLLADTHDWDSLRAALPTPAN